MAVGALFCVVTKFRSKDCNVLSLAAAATLRKQHRPRNALARMGAACGKCGCCGSSVAPAPPEPEVFFFHKVRRAAQASLSHSKHGMAVPLPNMC